jgi:hypothetical protein
MSGVAFEVMGNSCAVDLGATLLFSHLLLTFERRNLSCLYNEPTNAQLIDKLTVLALQVSTLLFHPLGARS